MPSAIKSGVGVIPRGSGAAEGCRAAFLRIRAMTDHLAEPLTAEDMLVQPMTDASPTKWHLAHTTWFFETFVLAPHKPGHRDFHPDFRFLFNSYYNAVGSRPDRDKRGSFSRPGLDEVRAYRRYVDEQVQELLAAEPGSDSLAILELGLHHEQQHQELMVTDIKCVFGSNPLRPAYRELSAERVAPAPPQRWLEFEGGIQAVGYDGTGFCFDNELERHDVLLQPFRLASRPVTNSEYLEFMEDGGYSRPELWLSEGWDAVRAHGWEAPLYWERKHDGWLVLTLAGMRAVEPSEPVCHVSLFEADAYARWVGARLPTEFEWEATAASEPVVGNFLESERFHPVPAAASRSLRQIFGDVWEWTASPYVAYPGFRPAGGALGEYNGKFMSSQMVLRGGSCATPQSHIRASYRNFFPPSTRWQFTGIRLAQ
ncbi:MAG TPA: ergothioneine biosynthesis protein EgtB [Terriglobales bacterium]|nr:ergothioneine biosynthesis protein EgtB [Terriglobales bacterium]